MSFPEPMRCLRPDDTCPSPLRCNDAGGCIEAQRDAARCYEIGLEECRKRGVTPRGWTREAQE